MKSHIPTSPRRKHTERTAIAYLDRAIKLPFETRKKALVGIHFVATKKAVLSHIFREKGIPLTQNARRAVNALPDSFRDWKRRKIGR